MEGMSLARSRGAWHGSVEAAQGKKVVRGKWHGCAGHHSVVQLNL